jgi:hypothetical protein
VFVPFLLLIIIIIIIILSFSLPPKTLNTTDLKGEGFVLKIDSTTQTSYRDFSRKTKIRYFDPLISRFGIWSMYFHQIIQIFF